MKTLEINKATKPLSDYARAIGDDPLLVVSNGKPLAVLSSVEGMDAESISLANNPKFVRIIQHARARHEAEGGVSADKLRRQLGLAPRGSQRKARIQR